MLQRTHDRYLELTMTAYLPALVWLLSGLVCLVIEKRRRVKPSTMRAMSVALLGPIAIPFVLAAKPGTVNQT